MGSITRKYVVAGNEGSDTVCVSYNPGSRESFIRRDVAEKLGKAAPMVRPTRFVMPDGRGSVTADKRLNLNIHVDGTLINYFFYVVDDLAEELIAGADLIRQWKISLDLDNETVTVDPRARYLNSRA